MLPNSTDSLASPSLTVGADDLEGQSFAAVDIGSNSFHLIVARFAHGQLQIIDRLREMVQLADGLDDDGNFTEAAKDRALDCLARFGERLRGIPTSNVRALATNTLRRARRPNDFLLLADAALGHPIEIISGHEEARLIYVGVSRDLAPRGKRRLVVDIGGGSTELIIGTGRTPERLDTLAVGCVGMSKRFFADGRLSRSSLKEATTAVALELRPIRDLYHSASWGEAVGSSGTIRAIARVLHENGWSSRGISRQGLKKLRRELESAGSVAQLSLPGLSQERRAVFPGGVAVLSALFRNLEIDEMRVSEYALREGTLYDLIGRVQHEDPRETSVRALATRYHVDQTQAAQVHATARDAFRQIASAWELPHTFGDILGWAAQLHEVGLAIAHTDYHRHGAYLAQHSTLDGFSRLEQLVLATLILGHRRKLTTETFAGLPSRLAQPAIRTCALLRLAVLLHRSRHLNQVPPIQWSAGPDQLTVAFPPGWLAAHPLTWEDLSRERNYWRRVGMILEFT